MNLTDQSARRSTGSNDASLPLNTLGVLCELDAYDAALQAIERRYPVLDPDSTVFDEEVMLGVCEWMRSLVRQGLEPVTALETASFDLLGPTATH